MRYFLSNQTTVFLISFKNQLPFFVLHEFFAMTMMPNDTEDFHGMIYSFFGSALPGVGYAHNSQYYPHRNQTSSGFYAP